MPALRECRNGGIVGPSSVTRTRRALIVTLAAAVALLTAALPASASAEKAAAGRGSSALWHLLPEKPSSEGRKVDIPATRYRPFTLDRAAMKSRLSVASADRALTALVLSLPAPDGGYDRFAVKESPVVAPALAARFPFVKTYVGQGIDDPEATARLDMGRTGFHAQVLSPTGNWYIDPIFRLDQSAYASYFKEHLPNTHGAFVEPGHHAHAEGDATDVAQRVVGTQLRTYRLALAADGEYSTFHGGTVPLVHNALVTAVNRVTGIYERDLAIRLQLVANNDSLIYLNASTDPYTNNNPGQLLTQNQANIDSVIGNSNYDIGHVFTTGGGGLAGLAVVGRTGQKARAETGLSNPIGDPFWVDYVSHEMGHQFGANHSFSSTRGSCSGNGNSSTAMEPGSGATIMSYAGICGNDNLQALGDDYFHAVSFDEIVAYTTTPGSPGNLGATPSGNTAPTISVVGGPFTIPARTPFLLTAAGNDVDGDSLTYTWEQYDAGVLQLLDNVNKASGPLFRSFDPVASPSRTFPRMSSILANTTNATTGTCPPLPGAIDCWSEFLPTVGRQVKFRASVRDNHAGTGGVNSADTTVTVAATQPFLVTAPNTAVTLPAGAPQTVTWNVSGTDVAPINTASVNILLSTDGGATFPVSLVSGTPNDGTQAVTLPAIATSQARVKIEAVGNIFFDVSDANFTITTGNAPPVANADSTSTPVNTAATVDVLANDTDSDGTIDPTSVAVTGGPQHGATSVHPATGVVTYTPAAGFEGSDSFTYTVEDDDGATSNAATVSIAVGSGGPVDVFPSSFTVLVGSLAGGTVASLGSDDNAYLVVNAAKTTPKTATWYGGFTGVDNATTTLQSTYIGKSSITCTQVISIWRWTDSTWVDLDTRSVGTTEVTVTGIGPSGSLEPFVSGTSGLGDVRVRVSCSNAGASAFVLSGDLLKITVGGAGTPMHTLSVSTSGTGTHGLVESSRHQLRIRLLRVLRARDRRDVVCVSGSLLDVRRLVRSMFGGRSLSGHHERGGIRRGRLQHDGRRDRRLPLLVHGARGFARRWDGGEPGQRRQRLPRRELHEDHAEDGHLVRGVHRREQLDDHAERHVHRQVLDHLHAGDLDLALDRLHVGRPGHALGGDHRGHGRRDRTVRLPGALRERCEWVG